MWPYHTDGWKTYFCQDFYPSHHPSIHPSFCNTDRYLNHITHLDVTSHIHLLNFLLLAPEHIWLIFMPFCTWMFYISHQGASLTIVRKVNIPSAQHLCSFLYAWWAQTGLKIASHSRYKTTDTTDTWIYVTVSLLTTVYGLMQLCA